MSGKSRAGSAKERSVFVGNIPYDVTEDMLKEIFSEAGSVVNFRLVTDRETGKPKGYGFCEYADGATALSAMRNLNGYEINGRNLRVDFADGGDKSGGGYGGGAKQHFNGSQPRHGNGNGSGGGYGGGGGFRNGGGSADHGPPTSVSGEMAIHAIESAIARLGPIKLYDMLVQLKEHARQKPEVTKSILMANPALTHAIVQSFKSLQIPIPSSTELQPALLAPPPMHQPPHMGGRPGMPLMARPPPMGGPMGSGILGMAPPGGPPTMMPPHPPAPATSKAGGTRWSARPGPLSAQATTSAPVGGPGVGRAPPGVMQAPPGLLHPPPGPSQAVGVPSGGMARSRDPRLMARDPRLAKRPYPGEQMQMPPSSDPMKRAKPSGGFAGGGAPSGQIDAIAELARDMTPQKLDMLPPNERQMLLAFMQQNNIPF